MNSGHEDESNGTSMSAVGPLLNDLENILIYTLIYICGDDVISDIKFHAKMTSIS